MTYTNRFDNHGRKNGYVFGERNIIPTTLHFKLRALYCAKKLKTDLHYYLGIISWVPVEGKIISNTAQSRGKIINKALFLINAGPMIIFSVA